MRGGKTEYSWQRDGAADPLLVARGRLVDSEVHRRLPARQGRPVPGPGRAGYAGRGRRVNGLGAGAFGIANVLIRYMGPIEMFFS